MTENLNLEDDDLHDLHECVVDAFDLTIADDEAHDVQTVGDLFALICSKLPPGDGMGKCAVAMAYYRLRRGLRAIGYRGETDPRAPVSFAGYGRLRAVFKRLDAATGLAMPQPAPSGVTWLGCAGLVLGIVLLIVVKGLGSNLVGVFLLVLGVALFFVEPGTLPAGCRTMDGFARQVASRNYGRLAREGARHREADIWRLLVALIASLDPDAEVTRETLLVTRSK
jgi:hypothetical protein